jgi:hypothetical protein
MPSLSTVERLVDLAEAEAFPLKAAILTPDDIDRWRLYLAPRGRSTSRLEATHRVASMISQHTDDLPGWEDLLYSVVEPTHPVVKAIEAQNLGRVERRRKISGAYGGGQYLDEAYVFHLAA